MKILTEELTNKWSPYDLYSMRGHLHGIINRGVYPQKVVLEEE